MAKAKRWPSLPTSKLVIAPGFTVHIEDAKNGIVRLTPVLEPNQTGGAIKVPRRPMWRKVNR